MSLDNYTSAVISMTGMTFDSVGGLYLAYDLLGGERGPLSKMTRIVTYSLMAVLIYAFTLNLKFALIAGIGMGSLFGLQLDWIGAGKKLDRRHLIFLAVSRFLVLTAATSVILSWLTACMIGLAAFCASLASTRFKFSPDYWYEASRKPEFKIRRLVVGLMLGTMVASMAFLGETISGVKGALPTALRLGLVVGLGTAFIATVSPFVEWYADNLPPKRMGYIGAILFLIGFIIQAIPSLVILLGL
jgi:hypothetical protein